jgi:hypothetical protein
MPAHRPAAATAATDRVTNVPRASVIIGLLIIGLCFVIAAGTAWPSPPDTPVPTSSVAITPDDPAAPTQVPVQLIGR